MLNNRKLIGFVVIAALVLLLARLALPWVVQYFAVKALNNAPGLSGSVGDVDLYLYRGAYRVEGLQIAVVRDEEDIPVLSVGKIDFSVLWSELLNGKVVAEISVTKPHVVFVDRVEKEEPGKYDALLTETSWVNLANTAFPLRIDKIEVSNGKLEFTGKHRDQEATFLIDSVYGEVKNISTEAPAEDGLPATVNVKGKLYGTADFNISGSANLHKKLPDFDVDASAAKLSLKHFDELIKMYAPFDLEAGSLDFAMELRAVEGRVNGYIEAGVHDTDVFSWKEDVKKDDDNPLELLLEGIIGGITALLENDQTERVATKIPVEGHLNELDTPFIPALVGLFRNAFVKAYDLEVDDIISYRQSEEQ